jgi:hypothetical protein
MARIYLTKTITVSALAANTRRTIYQLVCAAHHGNAIQRFALTFSGVVVTAKEVQIRMLRQTTAGTATNTTDAPIFKDRLLSQPATPMTIQTSGQSAFTVEPTASDVYIDKLIHPQSGYEAWYPFGQEQLVGRFSAIERIGWDVFIQTGEAALDVKFELDVEE